MTTGGRRVIRVIGIQSLILITLCGSSKKMWEQKEPSSYTHIHPCPRLSTNSSIVPITREGLSQLECLSLLLCNLKMLCSEQQSRHAITTAIQNQPLVDFLPCCCLPLNSQRASLTVDREWLLMSPEQSSVNRQAWTNYP